MFHIFDVINRSGYLISELHRAMNESAKLDRDAKVMVDALDMVNNPELLVTGAEYRRAIRELLRMLNSTESL